MATDFVEKLNEKQYPIIMYGVPYGEEYFSAVKAMGCDYVHIYGLTKSPIDEACLKNIQDYLELAAQHGLKVMFDLDGKRRVLTENRETALTEIRQLVGKFKSHPAVGIWYLFDEPELTKNAPPELLKEVYEAIKSESPDIPVVVCTGNANKHAKWSEYSEAYDIHFFDIYPVRAQEFPNAYLEAVPAFSDGARPLGKPVVPVLQAWNKKQMERYHKKEIDAGRSPADLRYPNIKELRFWNFGALIQGSPAVSYYSFLRAGHVPESSPVWMNYALKPALLEFREFTDLVHPAFKREVITSGVPDLFFAKWKKGETEYLALVNRTQTERELSTPEILGQLNGRKIQPWKFSRAGALKVENNAIQAVNMQPWEVLVFESRPLTAN